jgi:uncharacterized RDD family membrane protein YckC
MAANAESDFSCVPVGLLRSLASIAYDLLLIAALLMVLTGLVFAARAGAPFDPQSPWFRGLLIAACWAYFAWSWASGGQTVGMRAWRIVVTRSDGSAVGMGQASLRFLAAWLSVLTAGLGFLWSLFDRDRLAWHDRLSRTVIGLQRQSTQPGDREQRDDQ